MPLIVTMHVFSGVPDPQWVIGGDEETTLRPMLQSSPGAATAAPGGLGYRGFSIVDTDAEPGHGPVHYSGKPEIESFLLKSGHDGKHVPDIVVPHSTEAIARGLVGETPLLHLACPPCHAADAPVYNPGPWNTPAVQPHNNCYNYANNQATGTFAQPGRATGHMYKSLDCPGVQAAAISDRLVPHANFVNPLTAGHGWYVALVIWPSADYHWYRQDKVGCWSHKPGGTAARNVDNAGHAISDPKTANRGPYTVFCTYMITKRTVHIR